MTQTIWIGRGITPIECVVVGESNSIATPEGVKKMLKVRKATASPECTFDIREDEILNIEQVINYQG